MTPRSILAHGGCSLALRRPSRARGPHSRSPSSRTTACSSPSEPACRRCAERHGGPRGRHRARGHRLEHGSRRAGTRRSPPKVDLKDPASYKDSRWEVIDSLVRGCRGAACDCSSPRTRPARPGRRKCSKSERRKASFKGICRRPKLYGQFVTALATRYSGSYTDPADPTGPPLPRSRVWSILNEPNLNSWLYPATTQTRGRIVPVLREGLPGEVYAAGTRCANRHRDDQYPPLGETAPLGAGTTRIRPSPSIGGLLRERPRPPPARRGRASARLPEAGQAPAGDRRGSPPCTRREPRCR